MQIEQLEKWNSNGPGYLLISKKISERPLWRTNNRNLENEQEVGAIVEYRVVYIFKEQDDFFTRILLAMEQDIEIYFLVCNVPSDLFSEYSELFSEVCESFRIYINESRQTEEPVRVIDCHPSSESSEFKRQNPHLVTNMQKLQFKFGKRIMVF